MKKLAIVGTGIAGMSAAYFMKDEYEITFFEKNDYIGGHTNTINVHDGIDNCPMDTGFMVFNEETYPYLVKLFNKLKVPYKNTDMSFSVRNDAINLEYNGSSVSGIFAQKRNLVNLKFLNMVREILKFNKRSPEIFDQTSLQSLTIGEYVNSLGLGKYFFDNFLVPMSSAVWSTPVDKMAGFPAISLVRFFKNHGFVGVDTQLQWKTVIGGSREYRNILLNEFKYSLSLNEPVMGIEEGNNDCSVITKNGAYKFDKVIVATHADEALALLRNPTDLQKQILAPFSYQENVATVHTDSTVMPLLKKNWSSWNFVTRNNCPYTVYYMNRLQGVSSRQDFFININGERFVDPKKIVKTIIYHHPVYTIDSLKAQARIKELNQQSKVHFTGSYYRYGFHEDAILSSVDLCSMLLGREVL